MVRNDVDECNWRVNDSSAVHSVDDLGAGCAAQEMLALGKDGDLQGRELAFITSTLLYKPVKNIAALLNDLIWSILEWVESSDEDVG